MLRREFIKTTGTLIAASAVNPTAALAAELGMTGRVILPMNRNWRYTPKKVAGAESTSFNDAAFERIVIPHTNVKLPWHNFDEAAYSFVSTYRRRFQYPSAAKGKRVFVDFEGAMTASTVWINGVALGEYKGGFTPFSFELTKHLKKTGKLPKPTSSCSTSPAKLSTRSLPKAQPTFSLSCRQASRSPTVCLQRTRSASSIVT